MDWVARLLGHPRVETALALGLGLGVVAAIGGLGRKERSGAAYFPNWEPVPWDMSGRPARRQKTGYRERARRPIVWRAVPWTSFPADGIFGHDRDWFSSKDVAYVATFRGEELILIRNAWHGFPDPPEWGLASRPVGRHDRAWAHWGCFPELPDAWTIPVTV